MYRPCLCFLCLGSPEKGDPNSGSADLPDGVASPVVMASGHVIGSLLFDRVKALPEGKRLVTLRVSDVPPILMTELHSVVARIDGTLRLLASRVIRTSHFSMVIDLGVVDSSRLRRRLVP